MVTWPPPHQIFLGTALHMHLGNPTNHSAHALTQLHLQKPLSHIRSHVQVRALGRNVCGEALQPIADTKGKSSQIPALSCLSNGHESQAIVQGLVTCLLTTYQVPGAVLGIGGTAVKEMERGPRLHATSMSMW